MYKEREEGREREKMVITQMGRYAPSIHPMLPYPFAHATGVFNWPSTQCLLKHSASLEKGSVGNAVSSVMLEIYKMEKSG